MDKKMSREELNELSGQMMELFVADLFAKNEVNVHQVKDRLTAAQRESLKQTVEQLQAQVESFVDTKTVQQVNHAQDKTEGQANPLREAIIRKKQMKQIKNNPNR